jgi:hypothetical protein
VRDQEVGLVKEVKQQDVNGIAKMKSKGLGDTIEKITKATGIKKLVDKLPGDCGCANRKEMLNKAFPYKQKPNN